ncbi:efflux RND transporter periplasmic adaptor subunit [Caldimonas sp. KR1-144]|uniref:efflux RND transporter periplasmic adaptor subunit n=1 Tax=Caldimonas sp. KR1-144 TaxID=3400911 RepID=UPI003BFC2FFA
MNEATLVQPVAAPTKRRRRAITAAIVVVLLAGAGVALSSRLGPGKKKEETPAPPLQFGPAEVARPLLAPMPQRVEFTGPLVAPRTAVVRAKAAGTLLSLAVAEGSRVRAGQPLGSMDLADLQARINERSAGIESAQATLIEAERMHDSNTRLAAQNFISSTALQSSQARLDAARAALKSAQAQLETQRISMREAALVAPIDGIIGKRHVVPGEKLSAEQQLLTIVDLKTLELAGTVATHEVSVLQVGQAVEVKVEGMAKPVVGRIDRIAPSAEAGTRAIGVVVVLDNKSEVLRAGQYAQAAVTLEDPTPRLTVPVAAIGQASGQDFVWTVENGALVRRVVITGRKDVASGRVEVLQGLKPESMVLAARFDNLREGALAEVTGHSNVAPAASASTPRPAS